MKQLPLGHRQVARICHEANRALCIEQGDNSQVPWNDAPMWQRESAEAGVLAVLSNPDITPAELHEQWGARKIAEGWVYGKTKDADKKTHPCLVPYDKLPASQKIKDYLFHGIVRSMLYEAPVNTGTPKHIDGGRIHG